MRTIKFRAKKRNSDKWIYGNYAKMGVEDREFIMEYHDIDSKELNRGEYQITYTEVNPETVGQFTGLHDKNGKEIYEGDICKCNGVFKIIWYDDWCRFAVVSANGCLFYNVEKDSAKYFEVIGNCHDNPELLTN